MDYLEPLVDVCVALIAAVCVALVFYGGWLCLPVDDPKTSKEEGTKDETDSDAVVRRPRPRVRAGTGGR